MPVLVTPRVHHLWRRARRAVDEHPDDPTTNHRLVDLAREAVAGSPPWLFAHRQLAARAAATEPWRASLLARRVLRVCPDDDAAWGALGLAQSLLGNHRYAMRAYRRALAIRPDHPSYAHNLGHLYDAVLDQPARALPLLQLAWQQLPDQPDVVASYAHALARAGRAPLARSLLATVVQRGATRDQLALYLWVRERCPPGEEHPGKEHPGKEHPGKEHPGKEHPGKTRAAPAPVRLQRRRLKRRRTNTR